MTLGINLTTYTASFNQRYSHRYKRNNHDTNGVQVVVVVHPQSARHDLEDIERIDNFLKEKPRIRLNFNFDRIQAIEFASEIDKVFLRIRIRK